MESMELIYRGMFNHFPSTLVYKDKRIVGRPLLGARSSEELDHAFSDLLNKPYERTALEELHSIAAKPYFGVMDGPDYSYKIKRVFHFPTDMHVKFIRTVPNSELLLLFETKTKKRVHLYDSVREKIIRSWNNMTSPYMSADGKFAVFMDEDRHLVFQELTKDQPFFKDTMNAWYPGISVLKNKDSYRIITRMMDLKVQDYQIDFDNEQPIVTKIGCEHRVCTNFPTNATPCISRFGGDLFTLIQPDNSRQIVKVLEDNTCEPLINLGFWTWKATFNFDDEKISFAAVRINSLLEGSIRSFGALFTGHAFIYDLNKKRLTEIPDANAGSFSLPEFRSDGSIIVLNDHEGIVYQQDR
jgi:hypothetical protein